MKTSLPYIYVLLAAMLWGTVGTTKTFIDPATQPITIAMFRSLVGGGLLFIIALAMRKINLKKWSWLATFYAALAIALFQPLFFTAVNYTGVSISTVVAMGSAPVFTGIIEWIFYKRRPNKMWGIATLLAISGCSLLFTGNSETTINPLGITFSLLAGVAFATYAIVSKTLSSREEALPAVAMTFLLCGLLLLPISLFFDLSWITVPTNLIALLTMGIFATSLAYILFLTGLKHITSSSAVTLSLAEPLTAALLGVLIVGEQLAITAWFGVFLLLVGILLVTYKPKRNRLS